MKIAIRVAISAGFLLAVVSSFAVSRDRPHYSDTPRAFVVETIAPWFDRAELLFGNDEPLRIIDDKKISMPSVAHDNNALMLSDHPNWERVALTYDRILGIPPRFFHGWLCDVTRQTEEDEDYDLAYETFKNIGPWLEVDCAENVCIEEGTFDVLAIYCRLVQRRLRTIKERILKIIKESKSMDTPAEIEKISKEELLDSHEHDAKFQIALARTIKTMETKDELSPPSLDLRDVLDIVQFYLSGSRCWFVSLSDIRKEAYFPPDSWENNSCSDKDLHDALDELFRRSHFSAAQKHLVEHLDEWKSSLDSIPELLELSGELLSRKHDHEFLTKGAMTLGPKELLQQERESVLDMPFAGLETLQDSPRVKVLRTAREVEKEQGALNISFLDSRLLARSGLGGLAVVLFDHQQTEKVVAIAEYLLNGASRGKYTAKLGHRSSVTIRMQNETVPNDDLVTLSLQYYRDFVYGWRLEQ